MDIFILVVLQQSNARDRALHLYSLFNPANCLTKIDLCLNYHKTNVVSEFIVRGFVTLQKSIFSNMSRSMTLFIRIMQVKLVTGEEK